MAPVAVDGSMARPNTLLISNSHDVHVHHVFLHNSTDWTFKMVSEMSSTTTNPSCPRLRRR